MKEKNVAAMLAEHDSRRQIGAPRVATFVRRSPSQLSWAARSLEISRIV